MENNNTNNKTADQVFQMWRKAISENQPREVVNALFAESARLLKAEKGNAPKPVRIETSYRANGRAFRVAVYANGTTADLD